MIKPKVKIGSNTQVNFNASPEISHWSKKYNVPVEQIQQIFEQTGQSISKTLEILRTKEQMA